MIFKKIFAFIKSEIVLVISGICAAVSMIFVPPNADYLGYIDLRVISLLFCLMLVVAGFQQCGLFKILAKKLLSGEKSFRIISLILTLLPFFTSMLITNDVALITFVPFTIIVLKLINMEKYSIKIIVLQTIAANLGSMATPIGNPQNLFLYAKYQISTWDFFTTMLPLTLISLFCLALAAFCTKNQKCKVRFETDETVRIPKKILLFAALFLLCILSVFHLLNYWILLAIVVISLAIFDRKLFSKADYGLLLTFIFFFIFAGNIGKITVIQDFLSEIMAKNSQLTSILTSQVISNVPTAVLLSGFTEDWRGLLVGVNIGGLGTPIASLASLISLKIYTKSDGAKPCRYLAFFTAANIIGVGILCLFDFMA
ncbi:MAG: SLC13 family permease [Oscillospiraceae bacterium]